MEAEHYYSTKAAPSTEWTVIPYMGRTLSGMALMPYTQPTDGASISYKIKLPKGVDKVTVHVIVKSTLAFGKDMSTVSDSKERRNRLSISIIT